MIPPLGLNSNSIGGGPGFNSRSGPFYYLRHCLRLLAACTAAIYCPISLVSAASLLDLTFYSFYLLQLARAPQQLKTCAHTTKSVPDDSCPAKDFEA